MTRTAIAALGLFAAFAGVATAADPVATPGVHYRAKQVLGSKITIANDTAAGIVDDLVFDDAGNLEYLVVNSEGKLMTVPFEAARFDIAKKTAVVTITAEQWKAIPTYTVETYPNFYAPAYRTETYKYYGVAPRELRRIERRER